MKNYLFLFILCVSNCSFAQSDNPYLSIDKKIDEMPRKYEASTTSLAEFIDRNFSTTDEKIRAVFYWIATNINYDVANMQNQKPNQTPEEKITSTLKSRKGVCMHYAEVFKDITTKLGVETLLIDGYTKSYGKIATLSHIWCACKIEGTWYLFDPTWGAGYVKDQEYVKKLSNKYYKAEPKSLIGSHMPFDYLWQFSAYPISNQEFYDNKEVADNKETKFDFMKEIEMYQQLSAVEKAKASLVRIEKNGVKNQLITDRLAQAKERITFESEKISFVKVKAIINNFNTISRLYNEFTVYRNNKFTPLVSDDELKNKIQIPYNQLVQCQVDLSLIKDISRDNQANYANLKSAMAELKKRYEMHLNFVNEYVTKTTEERKKMFSIPRSR